MTGPFAGTRVLLVDLESDPTGHAGLRKRALERLGCVVTTCDLKEKQGLLARCAAAAPRTGSAGRCCSIRRSWCSWSRARSSPREW